MSRQAEILVWAVSMFGSVAESRLERAARMAEEALELAQACGLSQQHVAKISERVYSRPAGIVAVEIGQAGMTLEALAEVFACSVNDEIYREFERVQEIPKGFWQRRHREKMALGIADIEGTTGTPAAPAAQAPADAVRSPEDKG